MLELSPGLCGSDVTQGSKARHWPVGSGSGRDNGINWGLLAFQPGKQNGCQAASRTAECPELWRIMAPR